MAYIGNTQLNQNYVPAVDFFSGNGSTTAFTLSRPVASVAAIQATISNVPQDPGTAFTVSGSTITFTSAPPSGTNNIYVYYTSPNTSVATLSQNPVITGTATFGSSLTYGATGLLASFASSTNGYNQIVLQNASSGSSASSDVVVSNNSGTDSTNYGDFGINSSAFSGSGAFSDASGVYMYAQTGTMAVGTVGAQSLKLATNNTVRATIDSSGNVGIGTSSPYSQLDVYSAISSPTTGEATGVGSIRITNGVAALSSAGGLEFKIAGDTNGYGAKIQALNSGGAQLVFANRAASATWVERMRIDSSGNVLINRTSLGTGDTSKLTVEGRYTTYNTGTAAYNFGVNGNAYTWADISSGSAVERMRIDSSGNLLFNSGYGSVATAYGCRAWVNFNGTGTVAIRASGNVTSITDNGTGDYTVNFTNAMPDASYCVSGMVKYRDTTGSTGAVFLEISDKVTIANAMTTTYVRMSAVAGGSLYDVPVVTVAINR